MSGANIKSIRKRKLISFDVKIQILERLLKEENSLHIAKSLN